MARNKNLSVSSAARRLSCTRKWIYDLLYAGHLEGARKSGRTWVIPKRAVERRIKARARRDRS